MGWLRNFVRSKMKPIPRSHAMKMRNRLSFTYYFAAWNLFVLVIIYTIKYSFPETEEDKKNRGGYYARVLGTGDARVIKFRGFTKVGEYEVKGTKREPGRTMEEREAAHRKWAEYHDKMQARRRREYLGLPEPVGEDDELLEEGRVRSESEAENREDLNLLVEETSSL